MKINGDIYRIIAIVSVLLISGCQGKRSVADEETRKPATSEVDQRGFDPLELPEDREVVPIEHPRAGEISGRAAFVEAESLEPDTVYGGSDESGPALDSLNNQAYRIQLLTSKVYGDANYARQVAEEIFDRPVFMDYEVPYFKIRVGSFAERQDAEEYLMRVKSAGYTDAWVVMVNVRVKETAPLYDDVILPLEGDSVLYETQEMLEDDQP